MKKQQKTYRRLTSKESKELAKHFQSIMPFVNDLKNDKTIDPEIRKRLAKAHKCLLDALSYTSWL